MLTAQTWLGTSAALAIFSLTHAHMLFLLHSLAHSLTMQSCLVDLPASHTLHQVSDAYGCQGGVMLSAQTWLGIAAALLMVLLMASKVKAAIAWGVLFATVIAWIPGHHASYFSGPPGSPGALRYEEFKQVSWVRRGWCLNSTLTKQSPSWLRLDQICD